MRKEILALFAMLATGCNSSPAADAPAGRAQERASRATSALASTDGGGDAGPITLSSGKHPITGLAVHDGAAYWTQRPAGVKKCALTGCGDTPIAVANAQESPSALVIHDDVAYWYANGAIMSKSLLGGAPVTVAALSNGPQCMAADAKDLYWTEAGLASGNVEKCAVADCKPQVIASGQNYPWGIAVDAANVYWTYTGSEPLTGKVMQAPLAGGTAVTLAAAQNFPGDIAVSSSTVYWVSSNIVSCAIGGCRGAPTTLATLNGSSVLALDSVNVYVADDLQGVFSVPLGGGAKTLIGTPGGGDFIALGANTIAWVGSGGGESYLYSIAK